MGGLKIYIYIYILCFHYIIYIMKTTLIKYIDICIWCGGDFSTFLYQYKKGRASLAGGWGGLGGWGGGGSSARCARAATRVDSSYPQYRVRTTSLNSNKLLENYLNSYPLFGTKYLDYKDWVQILSIFKDSKHGRRPSIDKVKSIKSNMNDGRTVFVWDHLQNFYKLDK